MTTAATSPAPDTAGGLFARLRNSDLMEIIEAVLLSLTTVVTAWSAYQAALWDGEQSKGYTEASAARADASRLSERADNQMAIDLSEYETWLAATTEGEVRLADLIRAQMRPGMETALEAWIGAGGLDRAEDAPASPFGMPEYVIDDAAASEARIAAAEELFADGEEANRRSDRYVLTTVVFALVLFLVGIGSKFKSPGVRLGLATFATVALVGGVVFMAFLPIAAIAP